MASKRRQRRKECGSKVRHADQTAAIHAACAMRRNLGSRCLNTYRCKWCGGWHVGHIPGNLRRIVKHETP